MMRDGGVFAEHAASSCLGNETMTGSISSEVPDEEAASRPSQRSGKRRSRGGPAVLLVVAVALVLLEVACYVNTPRSSTAPTETRSDHEIMVSNRYLEDAANDDGVNDDAKDNNDDDAAGDDGKQEEKDREQNDDTPIYVDDDFIDDYYAFQEDPGPRTLLPITTLDVVGFLLASFGVTLAAGGGIGGGGYVLNIVDVSLLNSTPVLLLIFTPMLLFFLSF